MAYPAEVLADSPMLYWKLDEASGTVADDATANGEDGTISGTGVTYSAVGAGGDGGTALTFNGTSGTISSATTLAPASSVVTFECWASFPAFNNTDDLLVEYSPNANSNNGSFFVDPCSAAGNVNLQIRGTSTANRAFTRPTAGEFHHLVFVFDMSTATTVFKAYVDNVAQTLTGSGSIASATFGVYNLYLASRAASALFLNATIDHVALYNTELSAARVAAHFNAASGTVAGVASLGLLGVG